MSGWTVFAAVMLVVAGIFNLTQGLVALNQSEYLVNQLLFQNLDFWGWALVIWGGLQALAGVLSFGSGSAGPIIGICMSSLAAVLWFFMIFAAPAAAIIGVALNVLIIYGLSVRSDSAV
jgi:hypothetical protein